MQYKKEYRQERNFEVLDQVRDVEPNHKYGGFSAKRKSIAHLEDQLELEQSTYRIENEANYSMLGDETS